MNEAGRHHTEFDIPTGSDINRQMLADRSIQIDHSRRRGRAAGINPSGRFELQTHHVFDDGWNNLETLEPFKTEVQVERSRSIITRNSSPDIPFERSINPYRGCEHGCVYCFARPSHAHVGLSAGLDFESKLFAKPDAARLLKRELSKANYQPKSIAIGTNTDPYQPIEKDMRIMRQILEVLAEAKHPVGIVTKSALVLRDIDILSQMARDGLVRVAMSVTTIDRKLARAMEPRASTPTKRLEAMRELSDAGIPTSVMVAPVIPGLNDFEIERILDSAHNAGAEQAGYVLLRLPQEVSPIFRDWLLPVICNYTMGKECIAWGNDLRLDLNRLQKKLVNFLHIDSPIIKNMGTIKVVDILNKSIKEFGSEIAMTLDHINAYCDKNACSHCSNNMCNGGFNSFRMTGLEPSIHRYRLFVKEKVVNKIKNICM